MFNTLVLSVSLCLICPFAASKVLPESKDNHFDYLLLAQFWPPSSCYYMQEHGQSCEIPTDVHGWTIHGLWPSRAGSELPQNCNGSMPFDYSQIQNLRPQLDVNWHYYAKGADPTYLWKHEWDKHGTCAYSLPVLHGEMNYFSRVLQLHKTLNLTKAFEASGIIPSDTKTYRMEELNDAVTKFYSHKPVIVCDYDRKQKTTYLDQVYLCYDKTFNMIDCYPPSSSMPDGRLGLPNYYDQCEEKDRIFYPLFNTKGMGHRQDDNSLLFQSEN